MHASKIEASGWSGPLNVVNEGAVIGSDGFAREE
jgi:hypothetical protein